MVTALNVTGAHGDKAVAVERELTVYGNLSAAALRKGREPHLIVYHFAETLKQSAGDNGVSKSLLIDELRRHGIFASSSHVRTLLREGNGSLWTVKSQRVWLHSISRVAEALGATDRAAHRQVVNTRDLTTIVGRRGAVLGATLRTDKPISQAAIRKLSGVPERTQRRRIAKGCYSADRQDADITTFAGIPSFMQPGYAHGLSNGTYVYDGQLKRRLPNTYTPKGERRAAGRRSKQIFTAQSLPDVAEGALTEPRRYFDTVSGRKRARRRGGQEHRRTDDRSNAAYVRIDEKTWEAF